jgi:hypothetical protein
MSLGFLVGAVTEALSLGFLTGAAAKPYTFFQTLYDGTFFPRKGYSSVP